MNTNEFNNLIRSRRSVFPKDYTTEPVEDSIIHQMLENANWAPNHKLTEPWRFIVYAGDGLKQFANLQAEIYKQVTQKDGSYKEERYENLKSKPLLSSHIIVIIMTRDKKQSVPEIEEAGAVFCAIQNMYLTAAAYKVGCYLSTGGITYFEEAKSAFGLKSQDRLIGFLHVGMPRHHNQVSRRNPVADKIRWIAK